jgi:hypothetical protein
MGSCRRGVTVMVWAALAAATGGCATAPAVRPVAEAPRVRPDVHGEVLSLLPAGALGWVRLDLETLRRSPHYEGALELSTSLGADLPLVRRELGMDVFREGATVALAIYAPPGRTGAGWPVAVVRGRFNRASVLAEARARVPAAAAPAEGAQGEAETVEQGTAYTVVGQRAYMFPADDVMLVMARGLVRRVAARLAGIDATSALDDPHFADLLARLGPGAHPARAAVDLGAIRARQPEVGRGVRQAEQLQRVVAWADLGEGATLQAFGQTGSEASAAELARLLTAESRRVGGLLPVRLLGLSRLLREGVQATATGDTVRLGVEASRDEARRALRIATILDDLTEATD